jgi:hypothetical protein
MRALLGEGYAETLRDAYPELPDTVDFVTFWWQRAADLARCARIRRFGLITTNSIRQTFGRRVIQKHLEAKEPLSLVFAIPDHPWVDDAVGTDVRIAMTVGAPGRLDGVLERVVREEPDGRGASLVTLSRHSGRINADLTVGADVTRAVPLRANEGLSCPGVKLHGSGFIVTPSETEALGLGRVAGLEMHIRPYLNGRDLNQRSRNVMVIDLLGLPIEQVQDRFPEVYQWILNRVKPERDQNNRSSYRDNWWIFGEPRSDFRPALRGLERYIATSETSKHRFFVFVGAAVLADNRLVLVASKEGFVLGVLSSKLHTTWAIASGGTLEDRPVYNKSTCFEPFPFPICSVEARDRIRSFGEALDAHRKKQQLRYRELSMTDMYNVLDKLRSGTDLNLKDKIVHEQGLISVLKQIHDDLDAAVFDAYGWPHDLDDEEILRRLVELNRERAEEEKCGIIRWLRPEYQNPNGAQAASTTQGALPIEPEFPEASPAVAGAKRPWPKTLPEQAQAVRAVLAEQSTGLTAQHLARLFLRANTQRVTDMLNTLVSLGQARVLEGGRYVPT